ncbi:MAG TPA: type VI secretion system tip protein TssI/VgrG, partial [Polyangia bacterium]|nr:type VI secretion system tip protein TssI/VgrG [Polyangia bacterium]
DARGTEDQLERFVYAPGASLIDVDDGDDATPAADDQSQARHDEEQGYARARAALAGLRGPTRRASFATNRVDLGVGVALSAMNGPPSIGDSRMVITSSTLTFRAETGWSASAIAAMCDRPLRPTSATPRPVARGVVSAYVVGPPGEEIYTDELGRVRVRFPWDRSATSDERRTCWLRVNESMSGAGFGVISTPRVGDEVLVAFYEGDPDLPVVVGRLHHVAAPTPSPLPASASRIAWRTRSTPSSDGYHELAFEDKTGREVLSLRSERDLEKDVRNVELETIGQDRVIVVGRHHSTTIATLDHVEVGQKHEVTFAAMNDLHVADMGQPETVPSATRREIVGQRITLSTGGATIVLDGPDIVIRAERDIHWKAGGTLFIHGGPQVHINPPPVGVAGDPSDAPEPPDHVVWFKLTDDAGAPLAGVRCYVASGDGASSAPQVTGADGSVRFAVDGSGPFEVKLGRPPEGGSS